MKRNGEASVSHFLGFGTGWYFPESLQIDKPLDIPGLDEAYVPSYEEYLASMRHNLAVHALYAEGKLDDPELVAGIQASEDRAKSMPPIELPPLPF